MKPDALIQNIDCELHFRYAVKLGILPAETSKLPLSTLMDLYPEMQNRGISYYMVEQVKDILAVSNLESEPLTALDYLKRAESSWLLEMSSIVSRTSRDNLGLLPAVAAANAALFVDKFHANLGVRYYDQAITRSQYMKAFYSVIPENLLPVMPSWLRGEGW